jgi:hypothetical protein
MKDERNIRSFRSDLDTEGGPALGQQDGRLVAMVLARARRTQDAAFLAETYRTLYAALLQRGPDGVWDGSPLRVVLTQRIGELWSLCVGMNEDVERWLLDIQSGGVWQSRANGSLWNYWDDIRLYAGYASKWEAAVANNGGALMVLQTNSGLVSDLVVRIPAANVQVRYL